MFVVLWLSIPLVLANCLPVIAQVWSTTPLQPIDGGRLWYDGRPILGSGKTWEGFVWSIFFATAISWVLAMVMMIAGWSPVSDAWGESIEVALFHVTAMSVGALLGDLAKSFIKRRLGYPSGAPWPIVDQFDAVAGAYLLSWMTDPEWFAKELLPGRWPAFAALCIVYFLSHQALSSWAYRKGLKSRPH